MHSGDEHVDKAPCALARLWSVQEPFLVCLAETDEEGPARSALITVPATRRRGTHKGMPLQIPSTTMPMVGAALVAAQGVAGTMTEAARSLPTARRPSPIHRSHTT